MKQIETKKTSARAFSKKLEVFVFLFTIALVAVVAWPFVTTTIQPGHVGVYNSRFFGGTVLDKTWSEGVKFVAPWDVIIPYDARAQSQDYSITALTKGGLDVRVDLSVIWYIETERVGELHKIMGPDYKKTVIDPSVVSVVRSTIGRYAQNQLYDGDPLQLQNDVKELLNETLLDAPFSFQSILVREVKLPDQMIQSISEKFVAEQNVLAERYRVLEAVEQYKRSYVEAESIRFSQSIINEGMSEAYLRYEGIQATKELAASNNAKLVIIGDKDGLPLLLNTDDMSQSETLPDGLTPSEYVTEPGARNKSFIDNYNRIDETLETLNGVVKGLVDIFPSADQSIDDLDLPQINTVPTNENKEGE